ncbi:hypothetical protein HY988_02430 [Candidatus Micrarchaeota archaeon]|nr:hypothetical protein [Candidatus Micrarchaeota archaeon]
MLWLIILILLSLSIGALFAIKNYANNSYESIRFTSASLTLYDAISETCALGSGNIRKVELSPSNPPVTIDVKYDKPSSLIRFAYGNYSIVKEIACEVDGPLSISGTVSVKNENGKIEIS